MILIILFILGLLPLGFNPEVTPIWISKSDRAILDFDGACNVDVSGFNILYGRYNIEIYDSSNVTINNNTIRGGTRGIYAIRNGAELIYNLTISNNDVIGYFDEENWAWEDIKQAPVKMDRLETSGINVKETTDGTRIFGNNVTNWFNGILLESYNVNHRNNNSKVYNNYLTDMADDGLEFDDYQAGFDVYNNTVTDSFIGVSIAGGNCADLCYFRNNTLSADGRINWDYSSYKYGECFKMGRTSYYIYNWNIDHNTCYSIRFGIVG
ncbi:unnamed protein product, partial [marine sediment metagenome]